MLAVFEPAEVRYVFAAGFFDFAGARFVLALDLLPLPVRPTALLLLIRPGGLFVAVALIAILLIPFGRRRCDANTNVLALVAGQSERNQGQSAPIPAYMAPI